MFFLLLIRWAILYNEVDIQWTAYLVNLKQKYRTYIYDFYGIFFFPSFSWAYLSYYTMFLMN